MGNKFKPSNEAKRMLLSAFDFNGAMSSSKIDPTRDFLTVGTKRDTINNGNNFGVSSNELK